MTSATVAPTTVPVPVTDPAPTEPVPLTTVPVTTAPPPATTVPAPVTTPAPATTVPPPPTAAGVPDVFGLPQADAEALLVGAGYQPRFFRVCSGSVGEGEVRQVLWNDGGTEIIVVDKQGVIAEEALVPPGTELSVKVGTGVACG